MLACDGGHTTGLHTRELGDGLHTGDNGLMRLGCTGSKGRGYRAITEDWLIGAGDPVVLLSSFFTQRLVSYSEYKNSSSHRPRVLLGVAHSPSP